MFELQTTLSFLKIVINENYRQSISRTALPVKMLNTDEADFLKTETIFNCLHNVVGTLN